MEGKSNSDFVACKVIPPAQNPVEFNYGSVNSIKGLLSLKQVLLSIDEGGLVQMCYDCARMRFVCLCLKLFSCTVLHLL